MSVKIFYRLKHFYKEQIASFSKGGVEMKTSRARVFAGGVVFFFLFLLLEVVFFIISGFFGDEISEVVPVFVLLLLTGFYYFLIDPIFDIYNSYHELGPKELISVQGFVLSKKRKDHYVPYFLISGCEVRQGLLGRLFNFGDLLIGTSMTAKPEVVIENIEDPQKMMLRLNNLRSQHSKGFYSAIQHRFFDK